VRPLLALLLVAAPAITYRLVTWRAIDGDTAEVWIETRPGLHEHARVRLVCSAPELREDGGVEARNRLAAFLDGGARLETRWTREKYGRLLGDFVMSDGGRFCR
jgi:endonuclease YncB( thermonuclease family)